MTTRAEVKEYWAKKERELCALQGRPAPTEPTPADLSREADEWRALETVGTEEQRARWTNGPLPPEEMAAVLARSEAADPE
jgi:hypothetical protein